MRKIIYWLCALPLAIITLPPCAISWYAARFAGWCFYWLDEFNYFWARDFWPDVFRRFRKWAYTKPQPLTEQEKAERFAKWFLTAMSIAEIFGAMFILFIFIAALWFFDMLQKGQL